MRLYRESSSCIVWKRSFSPKEITGTRLAPLFKANRINPLRFFSVKLIRLGIVSRTSSAPPTTMAAALPFPFWLTRIFILNFFFKNKFKLYLRMYSILFRDAEHVPVTNKKVINKIIWKESYNILAYLREEGFPCEMANKTGSWE